MSNKEAVNVLQDMIDYQWGFSDTEKSKGIEALKKAIEVLKLIPDNATNGDMIKALFPNAEYWDSTEFENEERINFEGNDCLECLNLDWWNAPYKKGENNE